MASTTYSLTRPVSATDPIPGFIGKRYWPARSQSEALDVIAEAMRRLKDAEDKARLSREALGRSGEVMMRALKVGVAGLNAIAKAAQCYGDILQIKRCALPTKWATHFTRYLDAMAPRNRGGLIMARAT